MLIQNMRKYTKEEFQIFLSVFKAGRGAISENAQSEVRQTLEVYNSCPTGSNVRIR